MGKSNSGMGFEGIRNAIAVEFDTWYVSLLCDGGLCCAVLCCAVLCCAVLFCAVLFCSVLCCAVLCCAVLIDVCICDGVAGTTPSCWIRMRITSRL
jgi:hypothetical protein